MFKVASYLSFKILDVSDVLVAKLLDSKAKITKGKDFTHHKHIENCYNAAFFQITSIQDLVSDNCDYL